MGIEATPAAFGVAGGSAAVVGAAVEETTLYRGVNENHAGYAEALEGSVSPRGGNATPAEHNAGNTRSQYTSWTTNPDVAENFALRPTGKGVVLKTTVPSSQIVNSPSLKSVNLVQKPGTIVNESEKLLQGTITGVSTTAKTQ